MSLFGTGRKESVLAVLLLVGLALLQQAPGLFVGQPRRVVPPPTPHAAPSTPTEAATNETLLLPAMHQAGQVVADTGSWPSWNPHARFGEPFAVTGAPRSWPPFWLLALDGGERWLDLLIFLHSALAVTLAFRLLRCLGLSRYAAFLGGGSYGLGWFAVVGADRLPEAAAAALLPGVLETTWRCVFARRRPLPAAGVALMLALSFATGGTATAWLGTLLGVALLGAGLFAIERGTRVTASATWLLGALIATLVTAPLWLDALQNAPATAAPRESLGRSLQFEGLLGLFVPGLFGEAGVTVPQGWNGVNPRADGMELALYPGAIAWFLALLGLFRPKRNLMVVFWVGVAAAGLLLTLDGPIGDLAGGLFAFTHHRPGVSLVWLHLAIAVLIGLGVEGFLDAPHQRAFALPLAAWLTLTTAALAFAAVASPFEAARDSLARLLESSSDAELDAGLRHLATQALIPGLTIGTLSIAFLFWRRLGILRLKTLVGGIALCELTLLGIFGVPRGTPVADDAGLAASLEGAGRTALIGRQGKPHGGFLAVRGRDIVQTDGDAVLDRTAAWLEMVDPVCVSVGSRSRLRPFRRQAAALHDLERSPLLRRAGIDTVLAASPLTEARFGLAPPMPAGEIALDEDHRAHVPRTLSDGNERARLVFDAERAEDRAAASSLLLRRGHAGTDHVILESSADLEPTRAPERSTSIRWDRDDADHLEFTVDAADGSGYLVLADAHAPAWRATVDGQPAAILPADVAFRAVRVGPGEHRVRFDYQPWSRGYGMPLAAFGVILLAALGLVLLRFSRADRAARPRPKPRRLLPR